MYGVNEIRKLKTVARDLVRVCLRRRARDMTHRACSCVQVIARHPLAQGIFSYKCCCFHVHGSHDVRLPLSQGRIAVSSVCRC